MGGKLFNLGRLPKVKYIEIEKKLRTYLDQKLGELYRIPRFYEDKTDFGDVDVLVSSAALENGNWEKLKKEITEDLGIVDHKTAGNIFSTVYENFQVDFFIEHQKYFECSYAFLCFNDIGNLIGRIFKRFNLKYGNKGLVYVFRRADNHYSRDIEVCKDFEKIFSFLGLNYQKWLSGFASKKEMFEWVIASPYFSVTPYLKISTRMEKRRNERPTIQAFLTYIEEHNIKKTHTYEEKDSYIPMIHEFFPESNLIEEITKEKKREKLILAIREKYNGKIIMNLFPSLTGKDLGKFMKDFQAQYDDYEKTLFELSTQEIERALNSFFTNYNQ